MRVMIIQKKKTTASLREREERTGVSYSAALGDHAEAVGGGKRRPDVLAH